MLFTFNARTVALTIVKNALIAFAVFAGLMVWLFSLLAMAFSAVGAASESTSQNITPESPSVQAVAAIESEELASDEPSDAEVVAYVETLVDQGETLTRDHAETLLVNQSDNHPEDAELTLDAETVEIPKGATKATLKSILDDLDVSFPTTATKAELLAILSDHELVNITPSFKA